MAIPFGPFLQFQLKQLEDLAPCLRLAGHSCMTTFMSLGAWLQLEASCGYIMRGQNVDQTWSESLGLQDPCILPMAGSAMLRPFKIGQRHSTSGYVWPALLVMVSPVALQVLAAHRAKSPLQMVTSALAVEATNIMAAIR